jgi:hypothetical protein
VSIRVVQQRRQWAVPAVALTTLAWIAGVLVCLYLLFANGMHAWAAQYDDGTRTEDLARQSAHLSLWLAAVAVGGPALAAAFALAGRYLKTMIVYVVLTVLMAVPAVLVAASASRSLTPAVAPREPVTVCQEHSGSDNRCPGG